MIDLHSHVLPGLDDGARDLDGALAILRAMADEGVTTVAATPHVRDDYPTTVAAMREALELVRGAALEEAIPIEVLPGGELSLAMLDAASPADVEGFGLGGNPRLLLLEFPYGEWPYLIERRIEALRMTGVTPVLAHPERNDRVIEEPARLAHAVELGAYVQLTAASIDGRLGRRVARAAQTLLGLGLAHLLASDAHTPSVRAAGLAPAVATLEDMTLARWLVEDVPAALLAGDEPPPRPSSKRRGRRRGLRWRA